MIDRTPLFSQSNPQPEDPRNGPSLSTQLGNLNDEMAAFEDSVVSGYIAESATVAYASAITFTVTGDLTAVYTVGRRIRINRAGTPKYCIVLSSVFSTPNTTVTVYGDAVPNPVNTVDIAIQPYKNTEVRQIEGIQAYSPAPAGTATLNLLYSDHEIQMPAGNITIAVSNAVVGKKFMVTIKQDTGGSRTVTWPGTIKWEDGVAPVLTTTASKKDVFVLKVTGTDTYDGFTVAQNL